MKTSLLILTLVSFASTLEAKQLDDSPHIKIEHPIAKGHTGGDTKSHLASLGIHFPTTLQQALNGDESSLKLLIWMADNAGLDGAAAEGYGNAIVDVAKAIGDEKFSSAVKTQNLRSHETILFYFLDQFGLYSPKKDISTTAQQRFRKQFPKLWKVMSPQVSEK